MERVYSQRKRQVKEEISKEKVKKKDKWESMRHKQANDIYSAEIKNRVNGTLRPQPAQGNNTGVGDHL